MLSTSFKICELFKDIEENLGHVKLYRELIEKLCCYVFPSLLRAQLFYKVNWREFTAIFMGWLKFPFVINKWNEALHANTSQLMRYFDGSERTIERCIHNIKSKKISCLRSLVEF